MGLPSAGEGRAPEGLAQEPTKRLRVASNCSLKSKLPLIR